MKYYMLFIIPLLAALLVNLYYSFSNISRPAWFIYILIIGGIPAILYLGYYLTVGRKDYLVIDVEPTFTPS